MKFNKELVNRLEEYWNKRDTNYIRFVVEVNEKNLKVKRYDGCGFPGVLQTVYNNKQLEDYIEELECVDKNYREHLKNFDRLMKVE